MGTLSTKLPLDLLQTQWSQQLNQLLRMPILQGTMLTNITLTAATPRAIQTKLNRIAQGWFLTDNQADCRVWRTEDFNVTTLTLESNANTTISLWIF